MTTVIHDRRVMVSVVGTITHVLSRAMTTALTSMYARPRSIFACGVLLQ